MENTAIQRRWFRFGLSHLFVLTLGIALGFAPLKLWELNTRAEPRILAHVQAVELPRAQLAALGMPPQQSTSDIPVAAFDKSLAQRLKPLTDAGRARILAEPVLMTVSGRAAAFTVGGEIPVTITKPDGTPTVEYREFGTRVDILPTLLRNGRIRVELESTIRTAEQVASAEANLPSFRGTTTESECDLASGETVVVSANSYEKVSGEEVSLLILATVEKAKAR